MLPTVPNAPPDEPPPDEPPDDLGREEFPVIPFTTPLTTLPMIPAIPPAIPPGREELLEELDGLLDELPDEPDGFLLEELFLLALIAPLTSDPTADPIMLLAIKYISFLHNKSRRLTLTAFLLNC